MGHEYTLPELYDIAFDFRDVPAEVDFFQKVSREYRGGPIDLALELACGPAYHVREFARRGIVSHGLDLEPAMVTYANGLIAEERLDAVVHHGDMRTHRSEQKYDFVYMLMASYAHLLTNQDMLDNFECVANLLNEGGLYLIQTAHPRDFWGEEEPTLKTSWQMTRGDITVETDWGGNNQQFDSLTEVDDLVVSYTVTAHGETRRHQFPDRLRRCSMGTFLALLRSSGRFEIVDMFGDFALDEKLTTARSSVRFVPILRKI